MKQVYLMQKDRTITIDEEPYYFTQDVDLEHHYGEDVPETLYKIIARKNSCNLEIIFRGEVKYVICEVIDALQQLGLLVPVSNSGTLEHLLSVLFKEE